jgi:hypothetical protein
MWYCKNCPFNQFRSCGPWNDDSNLFKRVKSFHFNHAGFQSGVPEPTVIELFTEYFEKNADEMWQNAVAYCKGDQKICLLRKKWMWMSRA